MAEVAVLLSSNCTIRIKLKQSLPAKLQPQVQLPPFSTMELPQLKRKHQEEVRQLREAAGPASASTSSSPTATASTHNTTAPLTEKEHGKDNNTDKSAESQHFVMPTDKSIIDDWDDPSARLTLSEEDWFLTRRTRILDTMQLSEKVMDPTQWAGESIPLIQEYCAALDYYHEKGSGDCAFWYWSPSNVTVANSHQAYDDVMFEKSNICFNVATCEMRSADALVLSLSGSSGNAAQSESARTAYKFLCSAASWYNDGFEIMKATVEQKMLDDPLKKPVVPDSTSFFFAAMRDLCLAEAQEIAFHRADKLQPSPNVTHARENDGICARLVARVAQLYESAEKSFSQVPHQLVGKERSGSTSEAGVPVLRVWCKMKKSAWYALSYTLVARSVFAFGTELPADKRDVARGMKNINMAREELGRAMLGLQEKVFSTKAGSNAFSELCHTADRCWGHFRGIERFVNLVCDGLARINESVYCVRPADYQGPPEVPKSQELAKMKKLTPGCFN